MELFLLGQSRTSIWSKLYARIRGINTTTSSLLPINPATRYYAKTTKDVNAVSLSLQYVEPKGYRLFNNANKVSSSFRSVSVNFDLSTFWKKWAKLIFSVLPDEDASEIAFRNNSFAASSFPV